ncbi:autophagocytosis associated protein [Choanephora cucurbitarum]|nr:autophagocytosis associated protein [Choanephora cucurbitarum]
MSLSTQTEFEERLLSFYNNVNACALEPTKWSWETATILFSKQSYLKKTTFILLETRPNEAEADETVEEDQDPASAYASPVQQTVRLEHHIVYSTSYQVPVLYFRAFYLDGTPLSQDEIYQSIVPKSQQDVALSQSDHPLLGTPYWYIHPCQTRTAMETVQFEKQDYIKTWLSIFGPPVQCQLSLAMFLK